MYEEIKKCSTIWIVFVHLENTVEKIACHVFLSTFSIIKIVTYFPFRSCDYCVHTDDRNGAHAHFSMPKHTVLFTYKWIHFIFFLLSADVRLFSLHLIDFIYSSVQFGAHNRLRRDCSPLSITLINSNRFHWWHIVCCLILHLKRNKWNKRNIKVKWNENGGKKKQNSREQTLTNDPKRNFQRA